MEGNNNQTKIRIEKAVSAKDVNRFIDFPHELYKHDKNYVPDLFIAQKKLFNPKKNPFFTHSTADYFLAYDGTKVCGRIALIKNGRHLNLGGNQNAFFGFFDVINNYEVAEKLLNVANDWAKQNGFKQLRGPVNFSTNDPCGLLIDGFDSPPAIMMTYQADYHKRFLERFGLHKQMDLLAYYLTPDSADVKYIRMREPLEKRLKDRGIVIRKLSMKNFNIEVEKIHSIYNKAWESNWGFIPMSEDEFKFAAEDLKSVLDVDFAYIAEHNGTPIGFSLTIPNFNEVLIKMKRGRLFPSGLLKLLYYKNKIKSVRILTLGVIKEYRNSGIDACFYARNIEMAAKKNIKWAEASWILEDNEMMNRALRNIGAEVYKKYRIYDMQTT